MSSSQEKLNVLKYFGADKHTIRGIIDLTKDAKSVFDHDLTPHERNKVEFDLATEVPLRDIVALEMDMDIVNKCFADMARNKKMRIEEFEPIGLDLLTQGFKLKRKFCFLVAKTLRKRFMCVTHRDIEGETWDEVVPYDRNRKVPKFL